MGKKYSCASCGATSNLIRPNVDDPTTTFCKECKCKADLIECQWKEGDVVQIRPHHPYECCLAIVLEVTGCFAKCYIPTPKNPIDVLLSQATACYVGPSHWDKLPGDPSENRKIVLDFYEDLVSRGSSFASSLKELIDQWKHEDEQSDPDELKPWEYLKDSEIFWVGSKNNFIEWIHKNIPSGTTGMCTYNCRHDPKSGNIFKLVSPYTMTLRGCKPQMILVSRGGEELMKQHPELKEMAVFAHVVFLEDYE